MMAEGLRERRWSPADSPSAAGRLGGHSPKEFGRYHVSRPVGRGSFAHVYACFDPLLERQVALKVLNRDLSESLRQASIERFQMELRACGRLHHSNIVQIFDACLEGDERFLVMELCSGPTLADLLERLGRVPPGQAAFLLHQAALALDYVHACGVIHRDIKPANFLFQYKQLKLSDFGVAQASFADHIMPGALVGTPGYMSPEQVGGEGILVQSDLFSLAVVLYQMLAGRVPFHGDPSSVLYQKIFDYPPQVTEDAPDLPPDLDDFFARAFARNPVDRFSSGAEMCAAFAEIIPEQELDFIPGGAPLANGVRASMVFAYGERPRKNGALRIIASKKEKPPPHTPSSERIQGAVPPPWNAPRPIAVKADILTFDGRRHGLPGLDDFALNRSLTESESGASRSASRLFAKNASDLPVRRHGKRLGLWAISAVAGVSLALGVWTMSASRIPLDTPLIPQQAAAESAPREAQSLSDLTPLAKAKPSLEDQRVLEAVQTLLAKQPSHPIAIDFEIQLTDDQMLSDAVLKIKDVEWRSSVAERLGPGRFRITFHPTAIASSAPTTSDASPTSTQP